MGFRDLSSIREKYTFRTFEVLLKYSVLAHHVFIQIRNAIHLFRTVLTSKHHSFVNCVFMFLQCIRITKSLITLVTLVWPLPSVNYSDMIFQFVWLIKHFATLFTLEFFFLSSFCDWQSYGKLTFV